MRIGPRKLLGLGALIVVAAGLAALVVADVVQVGPALAVGATVFVALLVAYADIRQARRLVRTEQRLAARLDRSLVDVRREMNDLRGRINRIPTSPPPPPKVVIDKLPGLLEQTLRDMEGRQTRALQARTDRVELAVDQQREALEEQFAEATEKVLKQVHRTRGQVQSIRRERSHDRRYLPRLAQASLALSRELDGKIALPQGTTWTAGSDLLLYLYRLARALAPTHVLECGSGVSSAVMALALPEGSHATTLENDPEFAAKSRLWADDLSVADKVTVVDAPLRDVEIDGEVFPWYSLEGLGDFSDVELLIVDGPWGGLRERARQPALPMLRERLTSDVVVVIDDADRDDEAAIIESWQQLLPDHLLHRIDHQKGTAVLAPGGSVALILE